MRRILLGLCLLPATLTFAADQDLQMDKIPNCGKKQIKFKDYPVSGSFDGKPTMLNLESVKKKDLRNFLGLSPRKIRKPNFAKFYRIIKGGCGTMCTSYVAIDFRDGEPYPWGIAAGLGVRYRKHSSLIIMNLEDEIKKIKGGFDERILVDKTVYFYCKDNSLHLLSSAK